MIRRATALDVDELVYLAKRMHAESIYSSVTFSPDRMAESALACINSPHGIALIADGGFVLGGVVQPCYSLEWEAFEFGVYVEPDRRGSTLGARLIAAYVQRARELGAMRVTAGVTAGIANASAVRLYERMGFARIGDNFRMEV